MICYFFSKVRRAIQEMVFPNKTFNWIRHIAIAVILLTFINMLVIFAPNILGIFGIIGESFDPRWPKSPKSRPVKCAFWEPGNRGKQFCVQTCVWNAKAKTHVGVTCLSCFLSMIKGHWHWHGRCLWPWEQLQMSPLLVWTDNVVLLNQYFCVYLILLERRWVSRFHLIIMKRKTKQINDTLFFCPGL